MNRFRSHPEWLFLLEPLEVNACLHMMFMGSNTNTGSIKQHCPHHTEAGLQRDVEWTAHEICQDRVVSVFFSIIPM